MRSVSSRRFHVASFATAGVIGFGGVAAAGPAVVGTITGDDPMIEDVVALVETGGAVVEDDAASTEDATVDSTAETADAIGSDTAEEASEQASEEETAGVDETDENEEIDELIDETGDIADMIEVTPVPIDDPDTDFDETTCLPGNHGRTVSWYARNKHGDEAGGVAVTDAAHSSCGKLDNDDDPADDEADEADEADKVDEADNTDDDVKTDKTDKGDRADKGDRTDKADTGGKSDKAGKSDE